MVRSSKTGERSIDKLMQLLRSTLCVFMLVSSASTFAGQNILYYLSPARRLGRSGSGSHVYRRRRQFLLAPHYSNFARVVVKAIRNAIV